MSSNPPPIPYPLNPIFNLNDWVYSTDANLSLAELSTYFLLKAGDVATGLITFSAGLSSNSTSLNTITTISNTLNINNGITLLTGSINFNGGGSISNTQYTGNSATATSTATANTANISLNSAVSSGGSGSMYLALTQGTGGNYPIQTNIPTYNASSLVLTAPIFYGTTYITSPLLTTTPNGTVRIASTSGQYSFLQQNDVSTTSNLNITVPSSGLFKVNVGGVANLPAPNDSTTGLSIGWNSQNEDGNTDFINHAQGSTTGGFKFFNVNGSTPTTLIGQIPNTQPLFNDTSTTSIPTNYWVQNAITTAISGGATLNGSNTFTAQNTFNNFCPQTSISPTTNNSLVNLQYLNSVLTTNGIQNYNLKNPLPYFTTQQNSTFNSIQIQIPQSQFTSSAPPYKALKIRFNYILTGNSNTLMITNSGILNIYPLNTTSPSNTPNFSYQGTGGATPFSNPPNEYKYNITNNMYTSNGTLSNAYNALYTDDNAGLSGLKRWYYVSNINGGSPSGFSGTPYFSYLSYSYNGAGQFSIGFTTPPSPMPITSNPTYTGDPSYGTATQLNLNIFMEVISNDFVGSTVILQYSV